MLDSISPEVVAALGHIRRCDPVLAGRCAMCDELQDFWAQARAIVEPLPAAPGSAVELPLAQPRARIASR
jgi:hypothetical protein